LSTFLSLGIQQNHLHMSDTYRQVFENNKNWAAHHSASNPEFFEHLAKGQSPDFLFISCADSRVPVNNIMGLEPGEVFVHRNVANLLSILI